MSNSLFHRKRFSPDSTDIRHFFAVRSAHLVSAPSRRPRPLSLISPSHRSQPVSSGNSANEPALVILPSRSWAMYCPNCARENSGSENFCRSCGLKLDFISRVAAAEAAGLHKRAIKSSEEPSLDARKPASRGVLPGFLMFMAGTLVAFLGAEVLDVHGVVVAGVILVILGLCAIGLGSLGFQGILPKRNRFPELDGPDTSPLDETSAVSYRELSEPTASITEHTTKHLEASPESSGERPRDTQPTL